MKGKEWEDEGPKPINERSKKDHPDWSRETTQNC